MYVHSSETDNVQTALPQSPARASGAATGFVSWRRRGLDSWLDCFELWVETSLPSQIQTEPFCVCIRRHRIWCKCLIMMRLFVEAWLGGGVWQLVCASLTTQRLQHWRTPTVFLLTWSHMLRRLWTQRRPPNSSPSYFNHCVVVMSRQLGVLSDTARFKWLLVNCVSGADGGRTWRSKWGVKELQTEKETDGWRSRLRW